MMYYVGKEFDQKNKPYKTLAGATKAAEKTPDLKVFDETGVVVLGRVATATEATEDEKAAQAETTAPSDKNEQDRAENAPGEDTTEAAEGKTDTQAEITAPSDKNEQDRAENAPGEDTTEAAEGKTDTQAEITAPPDEYQLPKDSVKEIKGKIRIVFSGALNVRRSPSWAEAAICGKIDSGTREVVRLYTVAGKPMYETKEGYFISGSDRHVEFTAE